MPENNYPKLHNATWPGIVGKGNGSEPTIPFDTLLDFTSAAEVDGQKFEGIDMGLLEPHFNIESGDDPFAPHVTRDIRKRDVVNTRISNISAMPPGLINRLNPEELKDLLAYLKAGGNKQDTIFSVKKAVTLK